MYTLVIKCIIMYVVVLVTVRMMGKRQLGELQPFELVITLMLADFAVMPLTTTNLPLLNGVIPLLTLSTLHYILSFITRKSITARKFLCGNPVIIINENGLDNKKLRQLNMNINDVEEAIHGCDYFDFSQIKYAIIETNGKLSVIPKENFAPPTLSDLKIKSEPQGFSLSIIENGKLVKDNIKKLKISEKFITKQLKRAAVKKLKDCFVMTIDTNGKVYIQSKDGKPVSFNSTFKSTVAE